jgi:glyoxylase-like metal-dependent hydrolase (beta-lactamase superfamily II)
MQVQEVAAGLWRWTAPHPAWREGADWPRDVGCVYYEAPEAVVLVDPLVPAGEEERFWRALDRDVARVARPVVVVLTAPWHARSAQAIVERYEARIAPAVEVAGVEALPVPPVEEGQLALYLPEPRTLVTAEILAGAEGGLRVCPSPLLRDQGSLDRFLRGLLDLPIERILVSHGESILEDAHAELVRAYSPPSAA